MNRYRVTFSKTDRMIYIGHLDLLKYFQRVINRADLPIEYSKGFNPHQLMKFAIPLPLGMRGEAECLDIRLTEDMSEEAVFSAFEDSLSEGIGLKSVRKLSDGEDNCASAVHYADYIAKPKDMVTGLEDVIEKTLAANSIEIERTVKKKTKVTEIRPLIHSLNEENGVIYLTLATGSQGNLKAEDMLKYLYQKAEKEFVPYRVQITRTRLYSDIGVPL